jgi:hypothetical protein
MNLLRYGGVYLLISLLIPLALWGLQAATGSASAGSGLGVVPVLGAAMLEGQYFARAAARLPTKWESWRFALRASGMVLLVSVALVIVYGVIFDAEVFSIIGSLFRDATGAIIFGGIVGFILILALLTNRFFFWMGARNEMKLVEKRAKF